MKYILKLHVFVLALWMGLTWYFHCIALHSTLPSTTFPPAVVFNSSTHILRRRQWHPTSVLLPGKSHGQRSLVGCSPWGLEESDMTKRFHFHVSLSRIGEGNGNPLQCSCLENPRDGGAWWASVYGVAQSWTRLKWLNSSSSKGVACDEEDSEWGSGWNKIGRRWMGKLWYIYTME